MADFVMPSLGADMAAATLVKWLVTPGQVVSRGDIVAEVETEKGIIDIECFQPGVVETLDVAPGTKVPVGARLATLRSEGGAAVSPPSPPLTPAPPPPAAGPWVGHPVAVRRDPQVGQNDIYESPERVWTCGVACRRRAPTKFARLLPGGFATAATKPITGGKCMAASLAECPAARSDGRN